MNDKPRLLPGMIVLHFKWEFDNKQSPHIYKILAFSEHTETGEEFAVYESLRNGQTFVRPLSMFLSEVDREKYPQVKQRYRFEQYFPPTPNRIEELCRHETPASISRFEKLGLSPLQEAQARIAELEKEADWLAGCIERLCGSLEDCDDCKVYKDCPGGNQEAQSWRDAARKACAAK